MCATWQWPFAYLIIRHLIFNLIFITAIQKPNCHLHTRDTFDFKTTPFNIQYQLVMNL